jgi:predicted metal-dependent HD superfamily phosphohydrolase
MPPSLPLPHAATPPLRDALWQHAWSHLTSADGTALHAQLSAAYSEPHRHYHTLQHLEEACRLLQAQQTADPDSAAELVLALWFHDAVWQPTRRDNETASAALAETALAAAGVAAPARSRISALILATARHQAADPTQALLLDIDLAILGAEPPRFAEYQQQIRAEYAQVPEATYRSGRRAVLEGFLARAWIYQTPALRQQLEAQARRNLLQALAAT